MPPSLFSLVCREWTISFELPCSSLLYSSSLLLLVVGLVLIHCCVDSSRPLGGPIDNCKVVAAVIIYGNMFAHLPGLEKKIQEFVCLLLATV